MEYYMIQPKMKAIDDISYGCLPKQQIERFLLFLAEKRLVGYEDTPTMLQTIRNLKLNGHVVFYFFVTGYGIEITGYGIEIKRIQ